MKQNKLRTIIKEVIAEMVQEEKDLRYIATSDGMQRGYYKVIDTQTGKTVLTTGSHVAAGREAQALNQGISGSVTKETVDQRGWTEEEKETYRDNLRSRRAARDRENAVRAQHGKPPLKTHNPNPRHLPGQDPRTEVKAQPISLRCPKCDSSNLLRQPHGGSYHYCIACGYKWKKEQQSDTGLDNALPNDYRKFVPEAIGDDDTYTCKYCGKLMDVDADEELCHMKPTSTVKKKVKEAHGLETPQSAFRVKRGKVIQLPSGRFKAKNKKSETAEFNTEKEALQYANVGSEEEWIAKFAPQLKKEAVRDEDTRTFDDVVFAYLDKRKSSGVTDGMTLAKSIKVKFGFQLKQAKLMVIQWSKNKSVIKEASANSKLPPSMKEKFLNIASALSPENISWDGERPKSAIARERARLNAEWKKLEAQVGRKVSEDEVWT